MAQQAVSNTVPLRVQVPPCLLIFSIETQFMSSKISETLRQAAKIALPNDIAFDKRGFWLGCIGIRNDGALVYSKNGASQFSDSVKKYQLIPNSHAEGRLLRKIGKYGTIFVSRVSKKDMTLAMAKPCEMCQVRIKSMNIRKVYYTINETEYGIWEVNIDKFITCTL